MLDSYVLDSFALLAYFHSEPGRSTVEGLLRRGEAGDARLLLCIINYGEVLYTLERTRGATVLEQAIVVIDNLPIEVVDADRWLTFAAAHLKARHAISYADAFAAALAERESAVLVTGDPEFESLEGLIRIEWLERR